MSYHLIAAHADEIARSSRLLQAAVITLYTMYLTWSGMSNEPGMVLLDKYSTILLIYSSCTVHLTLPDLDLNKQYI